MTPLHAAIERRANPADGRPWTPERLLAELQRYWPDATDEQLVPLMQEYFSTARGKAHASMEHLKQALPEGYVPTARMVRQIGRAHV